MEKSETGIANVKLCTLQTSAEVVADVVTAAERDGCHSHGMFRCVNMKVVVFTILSFKCF